MTHSREGGWTRSWSAIVVVVALTVIALVYAAAGSGQRSGASDAPVSDALTAPDSDTAARIAATYGHSVIVGAMESETDETVAEPDGSFELTESTVPVRAVDTSGKWSPLDTDLHVVPGGVEPRLAAVPVRFSAGGTGAAVQVQSASGQWLSETWQAVTLPVPVVSGSSARYAKVAPGVDLVLSATATGFSQVVEIKNVFAATDPEAQRIVMALSTPGLSVSQQPGGAAVATNGAGSVDLTAGSATWWDSSASGSDATGPGGLATPQPVPATVTDSQLTIDVASVTAKQGLQYPVYVDPVFNGKPLSRTFTDSAYPGVSYWNGSGASDSYQHVGYIDAPNSDDNRAHTTRSYWSMNVHTVANTRISSARFNTSEVYSSSCSARTVDLWTSSAATPSTTWNNQPTPSIKSDSVAVAHGYSSSCPAAGVGFDATDAVTRAAGAGYDQLNFLLKAANESDWLSWKKFSPDATLVVGYVPYPQVPFNRTIECAAPDDSYSCGASPRIRYQQPTFDAQSDNQTHMNENYQFEIWKLDGSVHLDPGLLNQQAGVLVGFHLPDADKLVEGDWKWRVRACINASNTTCSDWSTYLTFSVDLTAPHAPSISIVSGVLGHGDTNGDGTTDGNDASGVVGISTETVKVTPNSQDSDVWGYQYSIDDGDSAAPIKPNIHCGDSSGDTRMVCPGTVNAPASITFAAINDDTTITVWAFDAAGNLGDAQDSYSHQTFQAVGNPDASVSQTHGHHWITDSESSTQGGGACDQTPVDDISSYSSTVLLPMAFTAGACRVSGQSVGVNGTPPPQMMALKLDGNSYVHTDLDSNGDNRLPPTSDSFTVGAWIDPADVPTGGNVETVLSQDGVPNTGLSGFFLQNAGTSWRFCVTARQDEDNPGYTCANSSGGVAANTWVYVSGIWDSINHQVRISVASSGGGGATQTQSYTTLRGAYPTLADAPGRFIIGADIGADHSASHHSRYFRGMVGDPSLLPGCATTGQVGRNSTHRPTEHVGQ